MTARRKAALKKAQMISARKRKKNRALKGAAIGVGGIALAGVAAYGGHKYGGKVSNIASDLKSRNFSMTSIRNNIAGRISPEMKERQMQQNAVSPASAARQAQPVNSPNVGGNKPTPQPNNNTSKPNVETFSGWAALSSDPAKVTQVPSEGAVIDPTPPKRAPFPVERQPTDREITHFMQRENPNFDIKNITRDDVQIISKMWTNDRLKGEKGLRSKSVGHVGLYTTLLDRFSLETSKAEKKRTGKK